jgi:Reverse transcriptase (RNA-dependent DNA polymerase)
VTCIPASAPVVALDLDRLSNAPTLSADVVVANLRAIDSFSGAGPDLLSARMFKLVLDDARGSLPGSTGGEILCAVAQMFANGDMPADIIPFFSPATVLATPKPAGGVRPVAIEMTLRRLISSVVLQRVTSKAREYLAPHQVAVGVKSGCDLVVHEVRSAIDEHGADDAYVLVCVHARKAFNRAKRANMLTAVEQHLPALAWLAYSIYGQPPLLCASDCGFESLEGTQQGCVLAMLLFSLVIHTMVMEITAACQLRVNLWEADDGTLFGRTLEVAKAMAIIRAAEDDTGYCMRLDKTTAWNIAMDAPLLGVLGCRLLLSDDGVPAAGIVLLGSPVRLPTFVLSFMHEKNAGMERLGALVQELGVPQLSYHNPARLSGRATPNSYRSDDPTGTLIPLRGDYSPAHSVTSRTVARNRYSCPLLSRAAVSWTSAVSFVRLTLPVSLKLRSLAPCSLGALPPPPLLSLLCWLMLPTYRALAWQIRRTCNLRPSSPVSAKPNQQYSGR